MSLHALYAAVTGMDAQQTRMNNIANNLANMNTTGFKAGRSSFEDLMYEQIQSPGVKIGDTTTAPVGIQVGFGTKTVGVYKTFSQGEFNQTGRDLDVAVEGHGFFAVTQDNGETAYTRDGAFQVNQDGTIVDARGLAIEPSITVPSDATSVTISRTGVVSATTAGSTTPTELGTITLNLFQNPAGLKAVGQNLFTETDASGSPTSGNPGESGAGNLVQGFLENSNVNIAEELINMIVAQRSYEANSRVLTTTNEMMRAANQSL